MRSCKRTLTGTNHFSAEKEKDFALSSSTPQTSESFFVGMSTRSTKRVTMIISVRLVGFSVIERSASIATSPNGLYADSASVTPMRFWNFSSSSAFCTHWVSCMPLFFAACLRLLETSSSPSGKKVAPMISESLRKVVWVSLMTSRCSFEKRVSSWLGISSWIGSFCSLFNSVSCKGLRFAPGLAQSPHTLPRLF